MKEAVRREASGEGLKPNSSPELRVNAIRRGGWASLPDMAKPDMEGRNVIGAGMLGNETCVTEGDLVCSLSARQAKGNCGKG